MIYFISLFPLFVSDIFVCIPQLIGCILFATLTPRCYILTLIYYIMKHAVSPFLSSNRSDGNQSRLNFDNLPGILNWLSKKGLVLVVIDCDEINFVLEDGRSRPSSTLIEMSAANVLILVFFGLKVHIGKTKCISTRTEWARRRHRQIYTWRGLSFQLSMTLDEAVVAKGKAQERHEAMDKLMRALDELFQLFQVSFFH